MHLTMSQNAYNSKSTKKNRLLVDQKGRKFWDSHGVHMKYHWPCTCSVYGHLWVIQCTCLRMTCKSKRSRRLKRSEIFGLGDTSNTYIRVTSLGISYMAVRHKCNLFQSGKWPSTCSKHVFKARVQKFGEISFFFFFLIFVFYFCYHGAKWEKKIQTTSCLKVHNRFAPKTSGILLGRVSTKGRIQKCEISDILANVFALFGAFNMGVNEEL